MPCDQTHLLTPYLDGELPASDMAAVREHLAGCADCAAEAEGLRAVGRLMGMARRSTIGEPSEQVMDRLRVNVREMVEVNEYGLLRIARLFTGLAASVLIAGLWLLNHQPARLPPVVVASSADAGVSIADMQPLADPGVQPAVQPTSAEPALEQIAVLEQLMGMPEVSNGSLEGELP